MTPDKTPTDAELEALARKHGATSYRNRADTQHPAYGFTEDGLRNLLVDAVSRWGSPVVAGEVVAWKEYAQHLEWCRTCAEDAVGTCHEGSSLKVSAMSAPNTPQPTQAQAGAVDDDRERLFWEACQPHGKVGEVVYMTYKAKRGAAMAAKGGES